MSRARRTRIASRLHICLHAALAPTLWCAALLGAAADVEYATLADAAMNRDAAAVRAMLERAADVNALGTYGTPALHWIVRVEDRATAGLLLDAGADPNMADRHGIVPLHLAIENGDRAMVDLLLAAGTDPRARGSAGETPLVLAARAGVAAIAERLLERGAPVDERDHEYDQTALMVAVREGHADVARLLLAHGADANAQTRAGATPAFRSPSENAGSKGVGIIRGGWPERGMRPPTPGAKTPLLYATRRGDLAVTRLLVEAGAALEQADADGVAPLLNALLNASIDAARIAPSGRQHLAVARYLLEHGASVSTADWYGQDAALGGRRHPQPRRQRARARQPCGSRRSARARPRAARARRRPERADARVSARAAVHHQPGSPRGSTSRDKRRFCAPRSPAT